MKKKLNISLGSSPLYLKGIKRTWNQSQVDLIQVNMVGFEFFFTVKKLFSIVKKNQFSFIIARITRLKGMTKEIKKGKWEKIHRMV